MPGRKGGHSLDRARGIFERRGDPCALCGGSLGPINYRGGMVRNPKTGKLMRDPLALDVDHIIPSCDGGTDDLSNLQASHHICNLRAGDKKRKKATKKRANEKKKNAQPKKMTRTSRKW